MTKKLFTHILAPFLATSCLAGNFTTLDAFSFRNPAEARQVWQAAPGAPRAGHDARGLVLSCPFEEDCDRFFWDRTVSMDLSPFSSFEIDLSCNRPEALRSLGVYFRSGDGWYVWNKPLREPGRHRLLLPKDQFSTEGKPAGWGRVDRIRISPWKGTPMSATLALHALTARKDSLYIVKATVSTPDAGERAMSARLAERLSRWLTGLGVSHAIIGEEEAAAGKLDQARLAILPLNPNPPESVLKPLRRMIERGGRLVVCFSASPELASLMNVRLGPYTRAQRPGQWEAMEFADAEAWHVPQRVFQSSWNIRPVQPLAGQGRVLARWVTAAGRLTDDPAWVATERGAWMTHVLLEDDTFNKQRMLLGILAHYDATIWYEAARHALAGAGKIDSFSGMDSAVAGIAAISGDSEEVSDLLDRARKMQEDLTARFELGRYATVVDGARDLRAALTEAYASCQRPRPGEFRAVWDHDGTGWFPGEWERTCRILAESGINTIFANVQWAGLAHYPGKVIPVSDTVRLYGDQVSQCLKAARANGLQVHAWKVCWNVEQAPDDFVARMKKAGRLLKSSSGGVLPWLDPSRADNQELELAAILELVTSYEIDGLHLDYIRYPPSAAKRNAGAITDFVRKVHDRVKAVRPDAQISAAVWGQYPGCIQSVGQDWGAWLKAGYIDFACPMNYTADLYEFGALLQKQSALPGARGRIRPGIGVSAAESQLRPDKVIEQILAARRYGASGFALFDLSHPLLEETLPMLRKGVTRPVP